MAIIDVVKWEVNKTDLCYKFPSDDLRLGSQLIVYTAQIAFFVKGGQICDEFTAGTYTIKTDNIPILNKLINIPFGGDSPFQAEVWFISQITRLDLKWGTPQPIQLEDPKFNIIIPIRAYGQYGIKVINPRLFLETLIGSMTSFTNEDVESYFRGNLVSQFNTIISRKITQEKISFLDINSHLVDLSEYSKSEINKYFTRYGIELIDFSIMSVSVPPDDPSLIRVKEAMAAVASIGITGKEIYQMERSFDVLDTAAANNVSGGQIAGIGFGFGIADKLSGMTSQMLHTNPTSVQLPPPPQQTTWFLYQNGVQSGGHTTANISSLLTAGIIGYDTLVWKAGMADWLPLSSIPELMISIVPPVPKSNGKK